MTSLISCCFDFTPRRGLLECRVSPPSTRTSFDFTPRRGLLECIETAADVTDGFDFTPRRGLLESHSGTAHQG